MSAAVSDVGNVTNWADEVDESASLPAAPLAHSQAPQPTFPTETVLDPTIPSHPPFKAYISNISYDIQPEHVQRLFQGLQIRDIQVILHRDTQRPRGVFVEFNSPEELNDALQAQGQVLLGRPISVQVARPKESSHSSRPGGAFSSKRSGFSDYDTPRSGYGSGFDGPGHLDRSFSGASDGSRSLRGRDSFPYEPRDGLHSRSSGRGGFEERPSGPFDRRRGSGGVGDEADGRWAGRSGPGALSRTTSVSSTRSSEPAEVDPESNKPRSLTIQLDKASSGQPKANPFGSAKPVDAAAKLRELDERDAKRKAEEATKRRAEKEAAQAADRAQRDGAAGPPQDAQGPPQRGWSRRGSRTDPSSAGPNGAGPTSGLQTRGSQGRGLQQPQGQGEQRPPAGGRPGEGRGPGWAQGNGQPHSALLHPSGGSSGGSGVPQLKRRPSNAATAATPSGAEDPGQAPQPPAPAAEPAAAAAPTAAPASGPSGGARVDEEGFERQGRGSSKAWAGGGRSEQAPAAARSNAWSQRSTSIRTPPISAAGSTAAEPPKLENTFAALNMGDT